MELVLVLTAAAAVIAALWAIWTFNRLVADRNLVAQGLADIDVQLKRRADLVPQLVETVRAYAAYEKQTLAAITELRARAATIAETHGSDAARFSVEGKLGSALQRLLVLQENYPALKADASFRDLSAQLVEVEDHLQHARRFYNGAVKAYLTRLQTFPDLLVARLFSFREAAFFETDDRAPVPVAL